jgi:hypothetical protein
MEHSFNIELAEKYGIEEAIIIQNMFFWIRHNVANRRNFYDDRYWTYNTTKAMQELFPYMSESKISRVINKLVNKGAIIKGNYNKIAFDRTCWYAFTDKFVCFLQNKGMDLFKMKNGNEQYDETIPYNKQDTNTDNQESTKVDKKEEDKIDYDYILKQWNNICPTFTQPRMLNDKRKRQINTLLKNNNANIEDLIKCFKIIASSSVCNGKDNDRGWKATFDWLINDTKNCFNGLLEGKYSFKGNDKNIYQNIIKGIDNVKQQPKKVEWQ